MGNLFRAFGDGTINAQIKKDYPFVCTVLMQSINEVTNDRNKRNIQANEEVPPIMWFAIAGGAFVIISMSFVIYMERPLPHMIMAGTMAAGARSTAQAPCRQNPLLVKGFPSGFRYWK